MIIASLFSSLSQKKIKLLLLGKLFNLFAKWQTVTHRSYWSSVVTISVMTCLFANVQIYVRLFEQNKLQQPASTVVMKQFVCVTAVQIQLFRLGHEYLNGRSALTPG